ncbi:MAG: uncharacterized protein conserved in archaea [uncultured archaeon A07HR60]|nr:MAG: uncharacterized protein conserved in archaea [Halorubrum sp. J07HR59]ESS10592.1 MAG: uncharacterized protein conserved in archaea [uncultured archaeon A07HR60]
MTTWIEEPSGGRDRGIRGIGRAWVEVMTHPRRFFTTGIGEGDQGPGLTFAIVVASGFISGWLVTSPAVIPGIAESRLLSGVVTVLAVSFLAAPAALHLTAALTTISLIVTTTDRSGVSQTVQVVAYATAPMALAGPPIPLLRVVCAGYGIGLLMFGLRRIHRASWPRILLASAVPGLFAFGVAYRGVAAVRTLTG